MEKKFLIFEVWGDYGFFKKFYTTSSPLTFSFPPRTAICGMLGAILGLDKDVYLNYFSKDDADIAVQMIKPSQKVRMGINHIDTKRADDMSKIRTRTQARVEFIKEPHFKIYVSLKDNELFTKLENFLKEHKTVYSICLGISELLADFKYIKTDIAKKQTSNESVEILTPIPIDMLQGGDSVVDFEEGKRYYRERTPTIMLSNREVTEYRELIFETSAQTIKAKVKDFYFFESGEKILIL